MKVKLETERYTFARAIGLYFSINTRTAHIIISFDWWWGYTEMRFGK